MIIDNYSGDRSNQVQDGENNDSMEQSSIPVSQERHKNEEKDSLANRKQESQITVTKKDRKREENSKLLLVEKIQILRQLTLLRQQKRKRKPTVGDIINRHRNLPQMPAIQGQMRNRIITGSKLSLKMKNLNGN